MIVINTNAAAEAQWVDAERDALYASHDAIIAELVANKEFVDSNELDIENVTVIGTYQGKPVSMRGPFTEAPNTSAVTTSSMSRATSARSRSRASSSRASTPPSRCAS